MMPGAKQNFLLLDCGANSSAAPNLNAGGASAMGIYAERSWAEMPKVPRQQRRRSLKGHHTYHRRTAAEGPCIHLPATHRAALYHGCRDL